MTDIANAAEVGVATLYRHFSTKTTIAAYAAIMLWQQLETSYDTIVGSDEYRAMNGAGQLERLLRTEQSMKIFTTRKQSGTYKAFSENMHCYPDSLESDRRGIFYSATETNSLVKDVKGRKGYVLLGSRAYAPTRWKEFSEANKDTYRTYAVALGDSVICKPICLYLAAFKEPDGNYSIPPVARDFLRDVLNKQGVTDKLQLKNIDQGQIVRPLEDFLFVE
jgi:hypothetical protein